MQVPQILLHGNPLVCDCHLEWLPSINEYGMEANSHDHLKVMDLAELECQLSHEENNFEEFMLVSQVCGLKYILGIVHIRVCSKLGFQLGHYSCNNNYRRDAKKIFKLKFTGYPAIQRVVGNFLNGIEFLMYT